ncbi:MAG: tetratricopeptide repeat protein [Deltaproteobacteria bacterium]|nr:tetratricopeptide repeat protein [Deltaproteobacteria bacterium]
MDESDIYGHIILGQIYFRRNQNDKAIEELETAVSLNPNSTDAVNALGGVLLWMGHAQKAVGLFEKAIRLDPVHAQKSYLLLARAYVYLGQYKEAIDISRNLTTSAPDHIGPRLELAVCYAALNRKEEAKVEVAEILKIRPNFSLESFSKGLPYRDPEYKKSYLNLLRKAGLK